MKKVFIILAIAIIITSIFMGIRYFTIDDRNNTEQGNSTKTELHDCSEIEKLKTQDNHIIEAKKPVIYLYPEVKREVSVELDFKGDVVCTYPKYDGKWLVEANPNGEIIIDGKVYSYLFWEGKLEYSWDIKEGFIVKGENTAEFLEKKLEILNLNDKERNDFIVYWLPLMERNNYNLVHFSSEEYEKLATLKINPQPDKLIRIFMVYKPIEEPIKGIKEQKLIQESRDGFTVVEWGGAQLNN